MNDEETVISGGAGGRGVSRSSTLSDSPLRSQLLMKKKHSSLVAKPVCLAAEIQP